MSLYGPAALSGFVRFENGVGRRSDDVPGVLDVTALAVRSADGQAQEERVPHLGRDEMDLAVRVQRSQQPLRQLVWTLRREEQQDR